MRLSSLYCRVFSDKFIIMYRSLQSLMEIPTHIIPPPPSGKSDIFMCRIILRTRFSPNSRRISQIRPLSGCTLKQDSSLAFLLHPALPHLRCSCAAGSTFVYCQRNISQRSTSIEVHMMQYVSNSLRWNYI